MAKPYRFQTLSAAIRAYLKQQEAGGEAAGDMAQVDPEADTKMRQVQLRPLRKDTGEKDTEATC